MKIKGTGKSDRFNQPALPLPVVVAVVVMTAVKLLVLPFVRNASGFLRSYRRKLSILHIGSSVSRCLIPMKFNVVSQKNELALSKCVKPFVFLKSTPMTSGFASRKNVAVM